MKDAVKSMLNAAFSILFVVAVATLLIWVCIRTDQRIQECESKGGTYLGHEGKCIPIQSIPLK